MQNTVILLQLLEVLLCLLKLVLNLFQLLLEKIDHLFIIILLGWTWDNGATLNLSSLNFLLSFKFFNIPFEFLDNFLAEMTSLGQLFLNIFVDLNVPFNLLHLTFHLVIFEKKIFCLLWLMIKFSGQLMILQNCKTSCSL